MLYAIVFLFFLQLLTSLIENTYAFGLLQTSIPPEVASVLFLFTPVLLLIAPRRASRTFLFVTGGLVLASRAISVLLDTGGQMLLSGLGVGAFILFLPALIWTVSRSGRRRQAGVQAAESAALAVLASILLRSLYSGNDPGAAGLGQWLTWGLALLGAWLLPRTLPRAADESSPALSPEQPPSFGRVTVLWLASASAFLLLYLAFASPTVISRWAGMDYLLVVTLASFSAAGFLGLSAGSSAFRRIITPPVLLAWNLVFAVSLILALLLNQIPFPAASGAYPLYQPAAGPVSFLFLALALLSYPVVFLDLGLVVQEIVDRRPGLRALGGASLLASVYLLLVILAQVFTTVYDYIPVAGPLLRDRFWLVYVLPAALLILPRAAGSAGIRPPGSEGARPRWLAAAALAAALAAVSGAALLGARPAQPPADSSLRVLTYNIQQGYNAAGEKDFAGQLELIRQADADVIGLQESDTARAAGGNSDVVRYMADRLEMYSYYGPTTVTGTFGIALLSRYPIENPRTFFMYSEGEQTAALTADITTGGQTFHVLVTHLGNGGPLIQQQQVLQALGGQENIIAMGDFNFRPDTEQYAQTTRQLSDAWLAAAEQRLLPEGQDLSRRIDHIFVSPGLRVPRAEYYGRGPSDHPAMLAEIGW